MAQANFSNRTVWVGDNLHIMRGINSACIDLIYLDPPFNSNTNYAAPIGSKAAGAEFKDTWSLSDVDAEWINLIESKHPALHRVLLAAMTNSDKSYLAYMAARLLEMRRILKPTGSIYLHCDPTMSHYLKLLMDAIFVDGDEYSFRREIVWDIAVLSGFKTKAKNWIRGHDTILFYCGESFTWNPPRQEHDQKYLDRFDKVAEDGRRYFGGRGKRRYLNEVVAKGKAVGDVWSDIMSFQQTPTAKEKVGYPTQKPLKLLNRIIQASSNERDTVLDPFCGCATACVSAEANFRQWAGIDISPKAAELVDGRIKDELGGLFQCVRRTDIPKRTDLGKLAPYKSHKAALYGQQEGHCTGCGEHFKAPNLTVDHIIARNKGGTDHIENLQLLCGHCNSVKGDRGMEYLRAKLQL